MAKSKSETSDKKRITIQISEVSPELKSAVEDLARLSRQSVSDMLKPMVIELVELNKQRIANFRRSAAQPIKLPTIGSSKAEKSNKPAVTNANAGKAGVDDE